MNVPPSQQPGRCSIPPPAVLCEDCFRRASDVSSDGIALCGACLARCVVCHVSLHLFNETVRIYNDVDLMVTCPLCRHQSCADWFDEDRGEDGMCTLCETEGG